MKLGTKLIACLVTTLIVIMLGHGYLSIQQDRENTVREMRVGMMGLSRSLQVIFTLRRETSWQRRI